MDDRNRNEAQPTKGDAIVDAVATGNAERLQDVVNSLTPEELQRVYAEIERANKERIEDGLPGITLVFNDADGDGHVDVSGTNPDSGATVAAEGESGWQVPIEEVVIEPGA